jgi:imidazolonepropionase
LKKGSLLLRNADELVTCSGYSAKRGTEMSDLAIIRDGAVLVEDGIIRAGGETEEIASAAAGTSFESIDAHGKAVLPGFVDAHTHFLFGGYREEEFYWRLSGESYLDILQRGGGILSTVRATRNSPKQKLLEAGKRRLDSMLSFGVTTVEGKSGYGLDRDTEIKQLEVMKELDRGHPVDIVRTYLGAHTVPEEYKGRTDAYVDFIIEEVLPLVSKTGLAEFCDVFCERAVFSIEQSRRVLTRAKECGLGIKMHADEIHDLGGAELAAELGAVSADHLLHTSDSGIRALAQAGTVAILLPCTAFSLKEKFARARSMIDSGIAVALSTDMNPGSCFCESIPLVTALSVMYMDMTAEEVVSAITINAAAALNRADTVGSIDAGKKADFVILEHPSYKYMPYHTGVNSVERVIKEGVVVYDRLKAISY